MVDLLLCPVLFICCCTQGVYDIGDEKSGTSWNFIIHFSFSGLESQYIFWE